MKSRILQDEQKKIPKLICFDLDGTLYQDKVIYKNIITHFFQDTLYYEWIEPIQEKMDNILEGTETLKCGQFLPKKQAEFPEKIEDLFAVSGTAALLLESPEKWLDRRKYSYISDGWTLAMYLARRIGWEGERFWERFQKARAELVGETFGPEPDDELRDLLLKLREKGIYLVLCSNAKKSGGEALLKHLHLSECFDEVVFDADKPHSMRTRMEEWGIDPAEMLFIGDQGYFDLYAGKLAGARTMLVSPYYIEDQGLWDIRKHTLEELKEFLRNM